MCTQICTNMHSFQIFAQIFAQMSQLILYVQPGKCDTFFSIYGLAPSVVIEIVVADNLITGWDVLLSDSPSDIKGYKNFLFI